MAKSQEEINSDLNNLLCRMEHAEKQLEANGKKIDGPVGSIELREYQLQMLQKLRLIRDTMKSEGSSIDQLRKERDEARTERDTLRKQVAKLEYRVEHLKKHVVVNPTTTP